MTTIAYKDGVMAGDTAVSSDTMYVGKREKVFLVRVPSRGTAMGEGPPRDRMVLFGFCGVLTQGVQMHEWLRNGMDPEDKPALDDDVHALLVEEDGTVSYVRDDCVELAIEAPFHAIGSGREIAIGAMAAGKTPEEAVAIAAKADLFTREPITTVTFPVPEDAS